ncbi:hypothetical protein KI387_002874, partial [Taxus chinensis]
DLKLLIAQIIVKDWTSIDSKYVAVIVDILRRNILSAVHMGFLSTNIDEELQVFVNFDTQEEVPDFPVAVDDFSSNIKDSGLYLSPCEESSIFATIRDVLSELRSSWELILPRNCSNGEVSHSMFKNICESLAERRQDKVQKWIRANTAEFCDNY